MSTRRPQGRLANDRQGYVGCTHSCNKSCYGVQVPTAGRMEKIQVHNPCLWANENELEGVVKPGHGGGKTGGVTEYTIIPTILNEQVYSVYRHCHSVTTANAA